MTDKSLVQKIENLKKKHNAVILAHNYQNADVQDLADFSGDSLELAQKGKDVSANVIVFCGVRFMAETAAILAPDKIVLLPDARSGCPMADMANAKDVKMLRAKHPGSVVVCYVNSTAEVKAESDVCCTSSNAVKVIERISHDVPIIFVPDQYLAGHVERMTGRQLVKWPGFCPTHARILVDHVDAVRTLYPGAPVIVHPECRSDVCKSANEVLSTGQMVAYAKKSDSQTILVGTEVGLLHRLKKENPSKSFVPVLDQAVCPNMKLNTLSKIAWVLEDMSPQITVTKEITVAAQSAVLKMFDDGPITPRKR